MMLRINTKYWDMKKRQQAEKRCRNAAGTSRNLDLNYSRYYHNIGERTGGEKRLLSGHCYDRQASEREGVM